MASESPPAVDPDHRSGHYRIWLADAPLWVGAWWKLHRVARVTGVPLVPNPRRWLERRGYVDELPW